MKGMILIMEKSTLVYLKNLFTKKDGASVEGRKRVCDSLKRQFNSLYETGYARSKANDPIDNELSYRLAQEYYYHLKELGFSFEFQSYCSGARAGQVYRVESVFYGPKDKGRNPFTNDIPAFMLEAKEVSLKDKKSDIIRQYKNLKTLEMNCTDLRQKLILIRGLVLSNFADDKEFVHRATMINAIVGLGNMMLLRAHHIFDIETMKIRKVEPTEAVHFPELVSHLVEMDSELLFEIGMHMEAFLLLEAYSSINYDSHTCWPEYRHYAKTDREYLEGNGPFGKYVGKHVNGSARKTTDILYANPYNDQKFIIKTDHDPVEF